MSGRLRLSAAAGSVVRLSTIGPLAEEAPDDPPSRNRAPPGKQLFSAFQLLGAFQLPRQTARVLVVDLPDQLEQVPRIVLGNPRWMVPTAFFEEVPREPFVWSRPIVSDGPLLLGQ